MANISAIKLPNGSTYDLVDKTSGYVTTFEFHVECQDALGQGRVLIDVTEDEIWSAYEAGKTLVLIDDTDGIRVNDYFIGYQDSFIYDDETDTYTSCDTIWFSATKVNQTVTTLSTILYGVYCNDDTYQIHEPGYVFCEYGSLEGALGNIVNKITTIAGAHTTISNYTGVVSFKVPTKTSHLTNDSGFITGMTILSYGSSTWQNFIDAYNANKVVYCRASSNSNPASGSQTRLAFMAYVNNATTPTEVEFQYYRSVSTHTASQQGDQVYVYKLNKTNGWSVTVREASVKVVAGTGLGGTYSNGTMTLTGPTKVSDLTNDSGFITLADLPIYNGGVS